MAEVINGYPFDSDLFADQGAHALIRIRDLDGSDTATRYNGDFIESAAVTSADVLIGMDGDFNVGRWYGDGPALLNQRMCCVRTDSSALSTFLLNALPIPLRELNDLTYSTTVKHLSSLDVAKIRIALPRHSDELSAVATFLDRETAKIDALIAEQEKLIALLAEKRQATISHAVTRGLDPNVPMKDSGVPWLREVPTHWRGTRVKHIKAQVPNAFVDGPFGSNLKSEHFIDHGEVFVIESNFTTQGKLREEELKRISLRHFESIERSEVVPGDIVIAKIGAQFGRASILPWLSRRAVVSGNSLKLTVDQAKASVDWIHLQLVELKACGAIDLLANGSAQPALSLGEMNCLPIFLPPLNEQDDIVRFVSSTSAMYNALVAEAQRSIDLLRERRSALVTAAVTGQIDVRNAVQPKGSRGKERAA